MALRYLEGRACSDVAPKVLVDALADHLGHRDGHYEKAEPRDGLCGVCGAALSETFLTIKIGGEPLRLMTRYCPEASDAYDDARFELDRRRAEQRERENEEAAGKRPLIRK